MSPVLTFDNENVG